MFVGGISIAIYSERRPYDTRCFFFFFLEIRLVARASTSDATFHVATQVKIYTLE